jgi:hypothetical protein
MILIFGVIILHRNFVILTISNVIISHRLSHHLAQSRSLSISWTFCDLVATVNLLLLSAISITIYTHLLETLNII